MSMQAEEWHCHHMLKQLREEYEAKCKPYIDTLCRIEMNKAPRYNVIDPESIALKAKIWAERTEKVWP